MAVRQQKYLPLMESNPFMYRAVELARNGLGWVSPNPQVGCVITRNGRIIGEGWHRKYGEAHAEVNAINQVADPSWFADCELFVTLEPCSHFGKTPPCSDLIIEKGIKKVHIAELDPNPAVNGNGLAKLEKAGILVTVGMEKEAAREINKRYFWALEKRRPYIILKWAQTLDGFIARENYDSKWISNELSRQMVHKWRSEEDAVLAGFNTARFDDPRLNVRDWNGRNPVRIILDKDLKLPLDLQVFDRSQPTFIFNCLKDKSGDNLNFIKINPQDFITAVVNKFHELNIQSVIVEGGSSTLNEFINHDLWDEARVFIADKNFGQGIPAPVLRNSKLCEKKEIGNDSLYYFKTLK